MSIIPTNFAVCKKIGSVLVGKDWFLWQVFGTFQEEKAYFRGSRPILKAQVMGNLFLKNFGGHVFFVGSLIPPF